MGELCQLITRGAPTLPEIPTSWWNPPCFFLGESVQRPCHVDETQPGKSRELPRKSGWKPWNPVLKITIFLERFRAGVFSTRWCPPSEMWTLVHSPYWTSSIFHPHSSTQTWNSTYLHQLNAFTNWGTTLHVPMVPISTAVHHPDRPDRWITSAEHDRLHPLKAFTAGQSHATGPGMKGGVHGDVFWWLNGWLNGSSWDSNGILMVFNGISMMFNGVLMVFNAVLLVFNGILLVFNGI